ncbi:hypothetical protein HDA40_002330 [Hamadaea flava]|uniref:Lipoprotein n=1 Tax=Hamadaea flava TaxID=1742688 RepID=A0ABV8LNM0_9ACTN|nr:hypothetical protein [Hamadaea flava]MCP2323823.1 hypothetical protein [Hamadaea flava]
MKITRILAVAALATALAGCGQSGEDPKVASAGGSPTVAPTSDVVGAYVEAVRVYVTCLRAEGLKVTDPDAKGRYTFEGDLRKLKADPKFRAGQQKCGGLLPPVPAELQEKTVLTAEEIENARKYAKCMRDNGMPEFPDPGPDGYYPEDGPYAGSGSDADLRAQVICSPIINGGVRTDPSKAQG